MYVGRTDDMLKVRAADDALVRANGMLEAFAWFNEKADHFYTFSLEPIPKPAALETALTSYFGEPRSIQLTPIEDWRAEVRVLLNRWLFECFEGMGHRLLDPKKQFALSHQDARETLVGKVIDVFAAGFSPLRSWRVLVDFESFYECAWDDLAFEEEERVVLLHLAVSD